MIAFLASLFGHRFWIPAYIALVGGFVVPGDYAALKPTVPYLLGGILFFTCLKIALGEVVGTVRHPATLRRVAWMAVAKLLGIAAVTGAITWLIAPDWTAGIVLVMAMPCGMSTAAFTDLHRGDRVLAILITLATALLCPLTVPPIMALVQARGAPPASAMVGQTLYLVTLLLVPLVAGQLVRRAAPGLVSAGMAWWGRLAIACLVVLIFVVVAANREAYANLPWTGLIPPLALCSMASGVAFASAWLLRGRLPLPAVTAYACGAIYVNNGLAMAYANRFHAGDAHIFLPAMLLQFPMLLLTALWGRWAVPHPDSDEPPTT